MATSSLLSRVIESQEHDAEISSIRDRVQLGTSDEGWVIHTDSGNTEEWRRQLGNARTQCEPPIISYLRIKVHCLIFETIITIS